MIALVGKVTLRSGERMTVKMIEPPQEDYTEKLCHFLEHKDSTSFRGIQQRLQGKYIDYCLDKHFVGEIDEQIVGQAWYGLPRRRTGVGNFGHVYVEPLYLRRGIATELVKILIEDFLQEDGKCLLCSASTISGKIYEKFGFEFVQDSAKYGPMALIKKSVAKNFCEFDEWYFEANLDIKVREGNIGDRHDCDRMLDFSRGINEMRNRWHKVFIASQISTFMDALFYTEDGKGIVTVIESGKGSILGYASVLNLGSEFESDLKVIDFIIHPNYLDQAGRFVKETSRIAHTTGITEIYAFSSEGDEEKVQALVEAGFIEEYRFTNKFKINEGLCDIVVFRRECSSKPTESL